MQLNWYDWNLSGTIPVEIGALSALTVLHLSDNYLSRDC